MDGQTAIDADAFYRILARTLPQAGAAPFAMLPWPPNVHLALFVHRVTGLEPGRNRGGECDTLRRFIYIHGCPDSAPLGVPLSHGCVRMHNAALLALFEQVAAGDRVWIG